MSVDKLVDSTLLDYDLTSVANAIRTKGGTSAPLFFPDDFITAIMAISSGVKIKYTGSVVNFNTASSVSLETLDVQITPVQSGSGNPSSSNIRPISGWSEAKVNRTGKNLFDNATATIYNRYISYQSPTYAVWAVASDSASYCIQAKPNTQYAIKAHGATTIFRVCTINENPATIGNRNISSSKAYSNSQNHYCTIITGESDIWIVIQLGKSVAESRTGQVMIEFGYTYSDFEPFVSQTVYTIDLDGIRYGGKLNVITGELTVTKENIASYAGETLPGKWISDRDVYAPGTTPTIGAQVVYDLATPQTIQLTPQQVTTLIGDNNIWADTGDVTVEYAEITT